MPRKLAIVPAYNEAESIARVISDLQRWAPDFDVVVIDDGSTDGTSAAAARAGAAVVTMPFNLGIGGGMQAGYRFAHEHGYDVAVQVDGDGQHDARQISVLLERLLAEPEVDMVVGSRFLAGTDGFRSTASRRLGIRIFGTALTVMTGQRVTDPTSGFRMTGPRGIALFARDYPHDYPEVEALLMIHAHRLRSTEVAVLMRERQGGASSITALRSLYYMVKVSLALAMGLLRARPVVEPGAPAPVRAGRSI